MILKMLGGVRLKVCLTHEKTCFAYISPKYSRKNEQNQCVQILCRDKHILLWVVFSSTVPDGHIACNPIYSRLIGLEEGAEVFVSPYNDAKVLDDLYVDADSPDDQEILEHNAELLQLRILDQLRLVAANQKAVVWISISLPIIFTPKQTGIIVNNSQIMVKVDAFNTIRPQPSIKKEEVKTESKFNNIGRINDGMLRHYLNPPKRLVLRAVPIDSDGKKDLIHPYTIYIHEDLIDPLYKKCEVILASIETIPSIMKDNDADNDNPNISDLCVEIIPINTVIFRSLCREVYNRNIPTVLIPKSLNTLVKVENGLKIILTILGDTVDQPDHIDIVTYSEENLSEMDVIERFKTCVIDNTHSGKKFLINNGVLKQNTQITNGLLQLKLKPDSLKYTMLNSESFRHCTVSAKNLSETEMAKPKSLVSNLDYDYKNYCRTMKSTEELVQKVVSHLYFEIHREASFKGVSEIKSNVLVTGASGTGKSTLCQLIQKQLTVWSHVLHCRSLKGRKDIPEVLARAVLQCQEHSPAVLVCDDVDSLVLPNVEGGSPQDQAYYQRLAVVIKHTLQSCSGVSVLMTANSVKELHPTLGQFAGKPLFTAHFEIPELDQAERVELFKHLVNERLRSEFTVEDDDVTKLAMDTSGYIVRGITDYLNKKIFKALKKKNHDLDPKPRLIEGISTDKEKSDAVAVWAPIGGMRAVKQQLTEAIFWPLMYPALFPSQSCGILLYGPPGTGKSHIGSCLASAAALNFIAVKGPELLSKYIGQSEKAVRDVFDKADMKRPCVLFFDEFDSLAPKRGHDSTGVTDRVVNQLLARLDGCGGGASGPVVAATSRPDLVDPALLRAGRLQRHVCCTMPELEDRHEILVALAKEVTLSAAVDLQKLAQRTEGFSPADLKSLLVTAQLASLEHQLDNADDDSMKSVVVSRDDIERALQETKPSLSKDQLRFYDMVYKRFRGESLSSEERLISSEFNKQRVTLA